jgi:hypothetical protein
LDHMTLSSTMLKRPLAGASRARVR